MPGEVTRRILEIHENADFCPNIGGLMQEERWAESLAAVREEIGEDPGGFKELCCMLRCALAAKKEYEKLGISDEIYYGTMGCFSRFVKEHLESFGCYGFDRGFWTVRQVSGKLFRIGELEYELVRLEGKPVISLHIPSDGVLEKVRLRESYEQAREVLGRAFPEYRGAGMYCHSWLLSPTLKELLPGTSRILKFQKAFEITAFPTQSMEFLQWVFKDRRSPLGELPEDTSLQRGLKRFLLAGGVFLDGKGFAVEEPFL